jgi:hypothetical protein
MSTFPDPSVFVHTETVDIIVGHDDQNFKIVRCYFQGDRCIRKERLEVDRWDYGDQNEAKTSKYLSRERRSQLGRIDPDFEYKDEPPLIGEDGRTDTSQTIIGSKDNGHILRTTYDSAEGRVYDRWISDRLADLRFRKQLISYERRLRRLRCTNRKIVKRNFRRGALQRKNISDGPPIRSITGLGSGLEQRNWPKPRSSTLIASKSTKNQLDEVTNIEVTRNRCTLYVALRRSPKNIYPVEHFKYWEFQDAARILYKYFLTKYRVSKK